MYVVQSLAGFILLLFFVCVEVSLDLCVESVKNGFKEGVTGLDEFFKNFTFFSDKVEDACWNCGTEFLVDYFGDRDVSGVDD